MATCCSHSNTKISKCGNTSLVHCQILEGAVQRCNFFRVEKRTYMVSHSHFRKLHLCTLVFLCLFFGSKIREIGHAVIPSEVVYLRPNRATISQIRARSPAPPPHNDSAKIKIIILSSIYTHRCCELQTGCFTKCLHRNLHFHLCFGGQGGDAGSVTCTLRWRLDGFYFYLSRT